MAGKAAASYKGTQYRNYWCSRATKSGALCEYYNGHSTTKLESAILEYLGQFFDPELVRQHIQTAGQADLSAKETELHDVDSALADLDSQFTQNLGFMRRGVLNEQEFMKANNLARQQVSALQEQKTSLAQWLTQQRDLEEVSNQVLGMIKTFIEDFQTMAPRVRKSHLQTILKSAHVRKGSLELEFRS
jgi:hypothetical protein